MMKRKTLFLPGGILLAAALLPACVSSKSGSAMERQIGELKAESARNAAHLAELQKQLTELKAKNSQQEKLKTEYISIRKLFENMEYGNIPPEIVKQYLDLITPPANAPKEAKLKFIEEIARLRINFNSERIRSRILMTLVNHIGHEYFTDMVAAAAENNNSYWLQEAARQLVKPSDKPFLKQNMVFNSSMGSICRDLFCRVADASDKEDVLRILSGNPTLWQCAARLGLQKEAASILKKQVLAGHHARGNMNMTNFILEHLQGKEREDFMNRYWAYADNPRDPWIFIQTGLMLAKHGYVPAFISLGEKINDALLAMYNQNTSRELLTMTPCRTLSELSKWAKQNKEKIVFNSESRSFELKK